MGRERDPSDERAQTDLTETIERLAVRIGDDIGREFARALGEPPTKRRAAPREKARCASEGCERDAVAKGLCKSHYNLMLYHRRKQATGAARGRSPTARKGGRR